jgi:riboflavin kinase / FMN adenylyltransferase
MELIRGLPARLLAPPASVVTIGSFDGIHLGHQALIRKVLETGSRRGLSTVLLTFEPLPREYLKRSDPPARLTSWRERWRALEGTGLDKVWQLRFDERLRNLSGEEFVELLARDLGAKAVVVGHDFRFGRGGEASAAMLVAAGPKLGFDVDVVEPVRDGVTRVSSSAIRDALAAGALKQAERWLGRPYSMIGRVVRGEQLGRTLGFPTANLRLGRRRSPLHGIFAVRVTGVREGIAVPGVASLGTRPTIGGKVPLLEAHVFDFDGDLYGREIGVEFVSWLRAEEKFGSLEALVEQMHRDAEAARSILGC